MFPFFILGRFFVELQVAVIPAGLNVPGLGGLAQGTARFFPVEHREHIRFRVLAQASCQRY